MSASPLHVSLVPAFDGVHIAESGARTAARVPSCQPPVGSPVVGVGHPDSASTGGSQFKSMGYMSFRVIVGVPGPPEDSDVIVKAEISDVRVRPGTPVEVCASTNLSGGSDYTGELRTSLPTRLTDRWNAIAPGRWHRPRDGRRTSIWVGRGLRRNRRPHRRCNVPLYTTLQRGRARERQGRQARRPGARPDHAVRRRT